jgi:hypothetical protein
MPRISEFYGIIIEMYWSDHNPPHFHAKYGEHRAEIDIRTVELIRGRLPPKAVVLVLEWAAILVAVGPSSKSPDAGKD